MPFTLAETSASLTASPAETVGYYKEKNWSIGLNYLFLCIHQKNIFNVACQVATTSEHESPSTAKKTYFQLMAKIMNNIEFL